MQYVLVSILSYSHQLTFTYHTNQLVEIGDIVLVELKSKPVWGMVFEIVSQPKQFIAKPILEVLFLNSIYKKFIKKLASYYLVSEHIFYKKIISQLLYKDKKSKPKEYPLEQKLFLLNEKQNSIFQKIVTLLKNNIKKPLLLHGVTGSGKTYIYIATILNYLKNNQSVICLFPNANLANTVLKEIEYYVHSKQCYQYHSHHAKEERTEVWQAIIEQKPIVICGVYLPIFLPIANLGCIIIDEEHDLGYVDSQHPYINIKESALIRAQTENIAIILSSATPSIVSYFQKEDTKYDYIQLEERYHQTQLPEISIVNITPKERVNGISAVLEYEIKEAINRKEQVLLFLNKKGMYRYAECSKCNYKFSCHHCSILLTIFVHHIGKCNRCGYKIIIPENCSLCENKNKIITIGYGLNKLTHYIEKLIPQARVIAIDGDILRKKNQSEKIISDINAKKYDIIVGTQIISKGYNFNAVSLVGIINADQNFYIPHFMTMEETIQQYIQVAGRSGREEKQGKVILQTSSNIEYLLPYLKESNYKDFIQFELTFRKSLALPPYIKMAQLLLKGTDESTTYELIEEIYKKIKENNQEKIENNSIEIILPQKCLIAKFKNTYYYQMTIKGTSYNLIQKSIASTLEEYKAKNIIIHFIPNPLLSFYQ